MENLKKCIFVDIFFYSYKLITIQILHSTILPLITLLHYGYDTMGSERPWLPLGQSGADPDRVHRFQKPGQIIWEKLPSMNTWFTAIEPQRNARLTAMTAIVFQLIAWTIAVALLIDMKLLCLEQGSKYLFPDEQMVVNRLLFCPLKHSMETKAPEKYQLSLQQRRIYLSAS